MNTSLIAIIFVAIGGAAGSVLRYLNTLAINKFISHTYPFATFSINLLGCFIIGVLMGMIETKFIVNPNIKLLLVTGFCGGYTTFSTFSLENVLLLQGNHPFLALSYILGSLILGIIMTIIGLYIGKII